MFYGFLWPHTLPEFIDITSYYLTLYLSLSLSPSCFLLLMYVNITQMLSWLVFLTPGNALHVPLKIRPACGLLLCTANGLNCYKAIYYPITSKCSHFLTHYCVVSVVLFFWTTCQPKALSVHIFSNPLSSQASRKVFPINEWLWCPVKCIESSL